MRGRGLVRRSGSAGTSTLCSASAGWRRSTRRRTATGSASPSRCSTRELACDPGDTRALLREGYLRQPGRAPRRGGRPRRRRDRRRRGLLRHGAARRRVARERLAARGARLAPVQTCSPSPTACSTCSRPPTPRGSSTATSSRRTSSCCRDGKARLLDFGIARLHEPDRDEACDADGRRRWGRPSYMPPEQARGRWEQVDGAERSLGRRRDDVRRCSRAAACTTPRRSTRRCCSAMTVPAPSLRELVPGLPSPTRRARRSSVWPSNRMIVGLTPVRCKRPCAWCKGSSTRFPSRKERRRHEPLAASCR